MKRYLLPFVQLDWLMLGTAALLFVMGIVNLATLAETEQRFVLLLRKQVLFGVAGFLLILALSRFDYRTLRFRSEWLLALWAGAVVLMGAALFWGTPVRGATTWLALGPLSFGPAEFAKLALVLVLAKYFASRADEIASPHHLAGSFFFAAVPAALALFQSDLGSAVLFFAIWGGIVAALGLPLRSIAVVVAAGMVAFLFLWSFGFQDYQKERLISFFSPARDPFGTSWQAQRAVIAVGNGGMWGRGFSETLQARLGMLPESATDFVFAALTEQFGFAGALGILAFCGLLFIRMLRVVWRATNNFSRAFAAGALVMLFVHVAVNIGMNIGLLPVSGIPFPFLSYGGSNLLVACALLGLLESVRLHQPQMMVRSPEVFEA